MIIKKTIPKLKSKKDPASSKYESRENSSRKLSLFDFDDDAVFF